MAVAEDPGALLVRCGVATNAQLEAARTFVANAGGTIGEALVTMGTISDSELTEFYRTQLRLPQVDANALAKISPKAIAMIPADMAVELRMVPIRIDAEGNLTVAMSDPANSLALDEVTFFCGCYVVRNVATQAQIAWCLAKYYNHVTDLAKQQVVARGSTPGVAPRGKSVTGELPASRRTASGEIPAVGGSVRQRSASGEFQVVAAPGESKAVGPSVVTIEVDDDGPAPPQVAKPKASAGAKPAKAQSKKPQQPNPPELFDRAGEVSQQPRTKTGELSSEPAVVIEDDLTPPRDEPSAPILLEAVMAKKPKPALAPAVIVDEVQDEASEPIELVPKAIGRKRVLPQTQVGVGLEDRAARDTEVEAPVAVPQAITTQDSTQRFKLEVVPPAQIAPAYKPTTAPLPVQVVAPRFQRVVSTGTRSTSSRAAWVPGRMSRPNASSWYRIATRV